MKVTHPFFNPNWGCEIYHFYHANAKETHVALITVDVSLTASSGDDATALSSSHFSGKIHQKCNRIDHRGRSKAIYWVTNLAVTTLKIIPQN